VRHSFGPTFGFILAAVQAPAVGGCGESSIAGCGPYEVTNQRQVAVNDFVAAIQDGSVTLEECAGLCGVDDWDYLETCSVVIEREDPQAEDSSSGTGGSASDDEDPSTLGVMCRVFGSATFCEGRRHVSWRQVREKRSKTVGCWLAGAAANEAASVHSFRALAQELAETCSAQLVASLRRAARQEVGHARLLAGLAGRRGHRRPRRFFHSMRQRSLLEIAVENAQQGCVNETLAGLIAAHQAQHALDTEIRKAFTVIAREEAEHADTAWALHLELRRSLSPSDRIVLDESLMNAIETLNTVPIDFRLDYSAEVGATAAELGLPTKVIAKRASALLAWVLIGHARNAAA
jgi:rubrerythrin